MKRLALIFLLVFSVALTGCGKIRQYRPEVVAEHPHDVTSYTQGLFFDDGRMFESTGQYGLSTFREVDPETGEALRRIDFDRKYFVEGSIMLDGKLYILTWQNHAVFEYDAETLEYLRGWSYPYEGWGLTTDGKSLIASDGSAHLYYFDTDFNLQKRLTVRKDHHLVRWLNELEYIDGKIWANVYTSDEIVIIDPKTGDVCATVDCRGLLPAALTTRETDVLNGIAYDASTRKIYLTGKNWPRLYEVRLKKK